MELHGEETIERFCNGQFFRSQLLGITSVPDWTDTEIGKIT